jgi:CheY-like chemotaxis protein
MNGQNYIIDITLFLTSNKLARLKRNGSIPPWQGSCINELEGRPIIMRKTDMSVLVVEDEKLLNWSLASSLSKWGFEVQPVFSGNEAMAQIEKSGFDVILLDYQLPDLDGLAVARCAREKQPAAVIFLLTAFQLNELPIDVGLIDDYFNKPLDLQQLHQALQRVPKLGTNLKSSDFKSPY